MSWFSRGEVKGAPDVSDLLDRMGKLESLMRTLETEQLTLHDQVRKWMRRAVAAERAVGRGQGSPAPAGTAVAPPLVKPASLRGARARMYVRRLEETLAAVQAGQPVPQPPHTNGTGEPGEEEP